MEVCSLEYRCWVFVCEGFEFIMSVMTFTSYDASLFTFTHSNGKCNRSRHV